MVVAGEADVGGGDGYFKSTAYFINPGPDLSLRRFDLSLRSDDHLSRLRRRLRREEVASIEYEQGGVPLRELVASSVRLEHFQTAGSIAAVLLSELALDAPARLAEPGVLRLPDPAMPELGPELQSRALQLEAIARSRGDDGVLLRELEQRAISGGLGDDQLAAWFLAQWFSAAIEGWEEPDEVVAAAARWTARFPESAMLWVNRAALETFAGRLRSADESLRVAAARGARRTQCSRIKGNIAWARELPEEALAHYLAARRESRYALRWQTGDCYAALGDYKRAMQSYRAALRRDPFLVRATVNARLMAGWAPLQPSFGSGWRRLIWIGLHRAPRLTAPVLCAWRWLRPEDPWVPAWLGRSALLRGDIRAADRWTEFATQFADTNRVVAHVDQVAILALLKDPRVAASVAHCRDHLAWLVETGCVNAPAEAAVAASLLRPKVAAHSSSSHGDEVADALLEAIAVSGREPLSA